MIKFKYEHIKKYETIVLKAPQANKLLKKAADKSTHCLLLQSEDSVFLGVLVHIYIREILNANGSDFSERLASNNIPDVIMLPRGEKVLTEDVQHIIETAYLTPTEFDTKIYVIDRCETMTEPAQNKLLKLLEEPPSCCRFILKCSSTFTLLSTVKSRSEIIEIQPLMVEDVLDILPDSAILRQRNLIAATSFGRLDYVEMVLNDNNYLLMEDLVFEIFHELRRSGDMVKASYKIQRFKDYFEIVLFYFECILHDCMLYSLKRREGIYFRHREKDIERLSKEYVADVVIELSDTILRARRRIKGNGNIIGIVDELLFSILEVKIKWQKL